MKLVWTTDIHLNFLPEGGSRFIGEEFAKSGDAILITGDISEAPELENHLKEFTEGFGKPVYYVLGNHDFYRGSLKTAPWLVDAVYLTREDGPIELSKTVGLVGDDGWYDCGEGSPYHSIVDMSDFVLIHEFLALDKEGIIDACSKFGVASARRLEPKLRAAAKKYEKVLVGTHVPPWRGATWHAGKVSDSNWLPWFCNAEMGRMIDSVSKDYPNVQFNVFAGHTHGYGLFQSQKNVTCITGGAEYGDPQITKLLDI